MGWGRQRSVQTLHELSPPPIDELLYLIFLFCPFDIFQGFSIYNNLFTLFDK